MNTVKANDELDLFSDLINDAREYKEKKDESKSGGDSHKFPLAFLEDGSYFMRFLPEITESEGKKKLKLIRTVFSHKIPKVGRFKCMGDDCVMCKEANRLYSAKVGTAYEFGYREEGILKAIIYRTNVVVKSDSYLKVETPIALIIKPKVIYAINQFLSEVSREDVRDLLNPEGEQLLIRIDFKGGKDGHCSVGPDLRRVAINQDLLKDLPSLDDIYIIDKRVPDDKQIMEIRKAVSAKLLAHSGNLNVTDPTVQETSQTPAELLSGNTSKSPTEIVNNPPSDTTCPSADKELAFGKHPAEMHPDCLLCPNDSKCSEATVKALGNAG